MPAQQLATLVYVRKNKHTLMLHRIKKENDVHKGKWNGLGGKVENGESPQECAVREVQEESGLKIYAPRLRGILTFPLFTTNTDWYVFIFTATKYSGDLIVSNEGELQWIENEKLLNIPLWEGDRIFLPWLDQKKFFSGKFIYRDKKLIDHTVEFY